MSRPYDNLTLTEQWFVMHIIQHAFDERKTDSGLPPLAGDDRCETFADAFATWIIESRPTVATASEPGMMTGKP